MDKHTQTASAPHQRIAVESVRDRFTLELFDRLWEQYRHRVSYVQTYEEVIRRHGATFVNDHIAFRTIATQSPSDGIHSLSRIFEAIGYRAAGTYYFDDKHLGAIHLQHANSSFPKLFVSELKTWELDDETRDIIARTTTNRRPAFTEQDLVALRNLSDQRQFPFLLDLVTSFITDLPWQPPEKSDVMGLNQTSQYGAWVLVHGYNVNHFTSLINSHGVPTLDDIDKTIAALQQAGVPMKIEIEGEPGSKLRQTSTEAVKIDVAVHESGRATTMPWTYAYFELAQRDWTIDPQSGRRHRFEGFLGAQATNLFEMTRVK